ncbi:hypothetical protein A7K91_18285 [Paenibacillus oryzae]|uniref:DUF4367 domain-containing protein n=1 Tax=Paenibacillus oryzae TaxID=1844972 RepID=A0A1A5YJX7_9BACL|nr:DUF4367 domain-containing protein [Paenibacillus oryzae]OBR65917.1 hypothetical protein A7K91_18285 [Paenibacillus oryzae]
MNNRGANGFDEAFDKAFESAVKEQTFVPDSDESWLRVQQALAKKAKRNAKLKLLPYVAASFLLGAFLFGTPAATSAFTPFIKSVAIYTDNVVNIIFGTRDAKEVKPITAPPPEQEDNDMAEISEQTQSSGVSILSFTNWGEAREQLPFMSSGQHIFPEYYQMKAATIVVHENTKQLLSARLQYEGENGESFRLFFRPFNKQEDLFTATDNAKNKFERLSLLQTEAYLTVGSDGNNQIEFALNDLYIAITTTLERERLLEIAKSIQLPR